MEYRRLGKAGIKVSELSLGAWVTYGGQVGEQVARECMAAAYDAGVNFFDNAEGYAAGQAEVVMGNVIKELGWRRESIVVSTKIFWGGAISAPIPSSGHSAAQQAIQTTAPATSVIVPTRPVRKPCRYLFAIVVLTRQQRRLRRSPVGTSAHYL